MFETYKVKELHKMISSYRNVITGYSKMKKVELVRRMEELFTLANGELVMKRTAAATPPQISQVSTQARSRIIPTPVPVGAVIPHPAFNQTRPAKTEAQQKFDKRLEEMEEYYSKHSQDEYPEFRIKRKKKKTAVSI